jgi:hypothetical protein
LKKPPTASTRASARATPPATRGGYSPWRWGGAAPNAAELARLRAEDDAGAVMLDGARAAAEFATDPSAVTLDGDLSDWDGDARLDSPATGAAGYGIWGVEAADAWLVALSGPDAIGPGTTLWIDADLDRTTGHQIWGFAGGAEFNVEVGADGVARLYTGAAGETPAGEVPHAFSADGTALELALPKTLVPHAPGGVRLFADVNDAAFLPNDYDNVDFIVAPRTVAPATFGAFTLDGGVGDWSDAERLDTPADGAPGFSVWGGYGARHYVFAIRSDGRPIGENTTICSRLHR